MGVEALRFLVGRWRAAGRVREDAVTATVSAVEEPDGTIVIDHVTRREGAEDHRERIAIRDHRGRTSAFIRSGSGPEQRFQLASADGEFLFTRADPKLGPLEWAIAPQGRDAFSERFVLGAGPARETVVELRHVRSEA